VQCVSHSRVAKVSLIPVDAPIDQALSPYTEKTPGDNAHLRVAELTCNAAVPFQINAAVYQQRKFSRSISPVDLPVSMEMLAPAFFVKTELHQNESGRTMVSRFR
jgi:hypothetical protein